MKLDVQYAWQKLREVIDLVGITRLHDRIRDVFSASMTPRLERLLAEEAP